MPSLPRTRKEMIMTDNELKLELARMLPEQIGIEQVDNTYTPFWRVAKLPFTQNAWPMRC